ncbi:MAG: hypothetical protein PHH28_09120 [Desulfuromonadaceae bacterium]|nr:hypothetical protein [Desulfuromonadaceae bacterium]
MNKNMKLTMVAIGSVACVLSITSFATKSDAAVAVDVRTPNVRVQVGNPAPPPPVVVMEPERVIVRERSEHHDRGKHKGHYKHKKHKKYER